MLVVFLSALLFGFVHPGSKLILDQGIPLSYFCLLYIGIRFVVQLPLAVKGHGKLIKDPKGLYLLIAIGLVGAFLQLFEFQGIDKGLPPATVTFLMFSYPVWIFIANFIFQGRSVGLMEMLQSLAAIFGIYFLSQSEVSHFDFQSSAFLYPLLASGLIAAWILLSNRLRKAGVGAFQLSTFYDLFSLIALIGIFSGNLIQDGPQFSLWAQDSTHVYGMIFYSILIGLLPNVLFYLGSRQVSPHLAGTALALEPLFSSMYSSMLWPSAIGQHFVIGGLFIVLANIPKGFWVSTREPVVYEK